MNYCEVEGSYKEGNHRIKIYDGIKRYKIYDDTILVYYPNRVVEIPNTEENEQMLLTSMEAQVEMFDSSEYEDGIMESHEMVSRLTFDQIGKMSFYTGALIATSTLNNSILLIITKIVLAFLMIKTEYYYTFTNMARRIIEKCIDDYYKGLLFKSNKEKLEEFVKKIEDNEFILDAISKQSRAILDIEGKININIVDSIPLDDLINMVEIIEDDDIIRERKR